MEEELPVLKLESPVDDRPDGIMMNALEDCAAASNNDDEGSPALDNSGNDNSNKNRLLLPDEQKMEDIEKPHRNDGKNEGYHSRTKTSIVFHMSPRPHTNNVFVLSYLP
jgi:hypothetical protein